MPITAAAATIKRGDIDDVRHLRMPRVIPKRSAPLGNHRVPQAGASDVGPQERIESLFVHLGTSRASLREVGVFSNPPLLRGVAFALLFAAAIIYLPPLQSIFHTAALGPRELIVLACFPVIVWGSDELWRWRVRRLSAAPERHPELAPAGAS